MPYRSKKQQRWMYWAEKEGKVPKGTADRWSNETKNFKKLPESARRKKSLLTLPVLLKSRFIV